MRVVPLASHASAFYLHPSALKNMEQLWLGYDGLSVRYVDVTAVLLYHPSLAARVIDAYGSVPANVRAVVVTGDGAYLPSSWPPEQLRRRWSRWRGGQG